jgi:hypothetical protein
LHDLKFNHERESLLYSKYYQYACGWLTTTHRLDIYEEKLAKTQFLAQFEALYNANNATTEALNLSTAYDYIRTSFVLRIRMGYR